MSELTVALRKVVAAHFRTVEALGQSYEAYETAFRQHSEAIHEGANLAVLAGQRADAGRPTGERRRADVRGGHRDREATARRWLTILGFTWSEALGCVGHGDAWQSAGGARGALDAQDAYHHLIVLAGDWLDS